MNSEDAKNFIKTYQNGYGQDPRDAEIKDHLEHGTRLDDDSHLNPSGIFKADEIPLKGVTLVKPVVVTKYNRVDSEIMGTPSILSDSAVISATNIVFSRLTK